jgi:ABC-type transport system involved in multi-copper enzyme maturation permease subunit
MSQPLSYRTSDYQPVPEWRRWWPLAWAEATSLFRTRWGVAVFCVCLLPALIRLAMLLIMFGVVSFGPPAIRNRLSTRASSEFASVDPRRVDFYVDPVLQVMPGMVFVLLLSSLVVARAIARDRSTNALELYWTRGISPWSYLLAKWFGGNLLLSMLTVLAPLALWITAVFLAEDWSLLATTWWQMLGALGALALVTAVWTGLAILLSAAANSPNGAMVAWISLLVGSSALAVVLAVVLREPWLRSCLSVWEAGGVVVRSLAGISQNRGGVSVAGAYTMLGALLLLTGWRASRRLRLGEAIG